MTLNQQRGKCHNGGKHVQDLPSPPFPRWLRSRPVSDESRLEMVTGSRGMATRHLPGENTGKCAAVLNHVGNNGAIVFASVALQHFPLFFHWTNSLACQKMALYDCCCALKRVFNKISCCYLCLAGKPMHTYRYGQILRKTGNNIHKQDSSHFSSFQAIILGTQQGRWE